MKRHPDDMARVYTEGALYTALHVPEDSADIAEKGLAAVSSTTPRQRSSPYRGRRLGDRVEPTSLRERLPLSERGPTED